MNNNNEINHLQDEYEYDSLLSYEGGSDFFEVVLGGLANLDMDSKSTSSKSSSSSGESSSSKSTSSSKSSKEISDMLDYGDTSGNIEDNSIDGGDERSYVFEDTPFEDATIEEDIVSPMMEGGDERSYVFEDTPFEDITIEEDIISPMIEGGTNTNINTNNEISPLYSDREETDSEKDSISLDTTQTNNKIRNLIKNMITSL